MHINTVDTADRFFTGETVSMELGHRASCPPGQLIHTNVLAAADVILGCGILLL